MKPGALRAVVGPHVGCYCDAGMARSTGNTVLCAILFQLLLPAELSSSTHPEPPQTSVRLRAVVDQSRKPADGVLRETGRTLLVGLCASRGGATGEVGVIPPALRLTLRGGAAPRADAVTVKRAKRKAEYARKEWGDGEATVRLASESSRLSAKRAAKRTLEREEEGEGERGTKADKVKRSAPTDGLSGAERRKKKREAVKTWEKNKLKMAKEAAAKEEGVKGWVPGGSKVRLLFFFFINRKPLKP